jgi:D-sedoheptulose 7-phosphate isomerase
VDSFNRFFSSAELEKQMKEAVDLIKSKKRIFFLGNGGSNSICSHMMEDFGKMGRFRTFAFSDPALITCYANDYGYEKAMEEWLKLHMDADDLLIAISSSGNSMNIRNAAGFATSIGADVITLSGFKPENALRNMGKINFYLDADSYGIVESYHAVILHIILDTICYE